MLTPPRDRNPIRSPTTPCRTGPAGTRRTPEVTRPSASRVADQKSAKSGGRFGTGPMAGVPGLPGVRSGAVGVPMGPDYRASTPPDPNLPRATSLAGDLVLPGTGRTALRRPPGSGEPGGRPTRRCGRRLASGQAPPASDYIPNRSPTTTARERDADQTGPTR